MKSKNIRDVISRNERFVEHFSTRIWQEYPSAENPYVASRCSCYGYDLYELMRKRSFIDVFFLLFRGELPDQRQSRALESLAIALANLGPRHPATRAAMYAAVGKTNPSNILPIGLTVLGGDVGAGCIEESMRFLRKNKEKDAQVLTNEIIQNTKPPEEGDWVPVPGFGTHYGGIDEFASGIAESMMNLFEADKVLRWGQDFAAALRPYGGGWLITGVASAVFCDLGFQPKAGAGLYQLLSAPGILAHGLEFISKPRTALPFHSDEDYIIER